MALGSVYLMSKVYLGVGGLSWVRICWVRCTLTLGVSGPKWVENLMTQVCHGLRVGVLDDSGVPWSRGQGQGQGQGHVVGPNNYIYFMCYHLWWI